MTSRILILLPVHNRRDITRRFIECLCSQRYTNFHLILIDDGSIDGTSDMVREMISDVTVIRGTGKWWWAGSLQQGLEWLKRKRPAARDIVLFINDDVRFDSEFLAAAVEELSANSGCMLLSRLRDAYTGDILESGVCADLRKMAFAVASSPANVNCLSTRGLFVHWASVKAIGDFHPWLLPHYWSDYEYTIRAIRKGFRYCAKDSVWVEADFRSTGDRFLGDAVGWNFVRRLFSVRSIHNPFFKSNFVFLAVPLRWKFQNLFRIWLISARQLFLQGLLRRRSER